MKCLVQFLTVVGLTLDVLGFLYLAKANWENSFGTFVGNFLEKIPVLGRNEKARHWYANPTPFGITLALLGFSVLLLAAILGFFVID